MSQQGEEGDPQPDDSDTEQNDRQPNLERFAQIEAGGDFLGRCAYWQRKYLPREVECCDDAYPPTDNGGIRRFYINKNKTRHRGQKRDRRLNDDYSFCCPFSACKRFRSNHFKGASSPVLTPLQSLFLLGYQNCYAY